MTYVQGAEKNNCLLPADFRRMAIAAVCAAVFGVTGLAAEVKNGGFEQTYVRDPNAPEIAALRKVGWKLQSPLVWPEEWEGTPTASNVDFATVKDSPHAGTNCILLWGQAGSSGYLSQEVQGLKKGIYKLSFWGKGNPQAKATLILGNVHIVLNAHMTGQWTEYSGIYRNIAAQEADLTLQGQKGEVFFDDVSIVECDVLEAALVEESLTMRKEGKWLAPGAKPDAKVFQKNVREVARVIPELKTYVEADPIPANVKLIRLLEARAAQLEKIAAAPTVAQANEAAACARLAQRLVIELQFEDVEK